MQLLPGSPHPLGATWDGHGVNFALYSENATGVELCLFDEQGEETRLPVPQRTAFVWHAYVAGIRPGQRYGYRVHGPYDPESGLRFNPNWCCSIRTRGPAMRSERLGARLLRLRAGRRGGRPGHAAVARSSACRAAW